MLDADLKIRVEIKINLNKKFGLSERMNHIIQINFIC